MAGFSVNRRRRCALSRASRAVCEPIERRWLLTSNLFLDFGDNLPVGGLQMTTLQLRDTFGNSGLQGPDLRQADNAMTAINETITDATNLVFTALSPLITFDYNQDGMTNNTDYTDLRAAVLSLAQRYYAVFDVNVSVAPAVDNTTSATYMTGVRTQLQAGANSDGERDGWVFISNITRQNDGLSVGLLTGNFGVSNGGDIGGNNAADNVSLTYADRVINSTNFTGSDADTRLAYTAAHEGGHDFGLRHTNNGFDNNNNSASGSAQTDADMILQTSSNLVTDSAPAVVRQNFVFATRFALVRGDGNTGGAFSTADTVNHYNNLSNNNNLGLRANAPGYITGTGAFDLITLTNGGGTTVNVNVQTHRDTSFNNLTSTIGSSINYSVDSTNGILIEMGLNADRLILNADIAANVTVRGMNGNDQLVVMGNNAANATYTPDSDSVDALDDQTYFGGTITVGSTTIQMEEFLPGGRVTIQDVTNLTFVTPNDEDNLQIDTPAMNQMGVSGTSGGVNFVRLGFINVTNFILDTATNDGGAGDDVIEVFSSGVATGLQTISIQTGSGNDEVEINFILGNQVPSGGLSYNGGTGTDDRLIMRQGSFTNETYTATGTGAGMIDLDGSVITFSNLSPVDDVVPVVNLTITAPATNDTINVVDGPLVFATATTQVNSGLANTFELINFANKNNVTISGGDGNDDFNVITPSLTTAGLNSLVLQGAAGNDTFNLRANANLALTVDGGSHAIGDRLNIDGESLDFDFTNTMLDSATREAITYSNIETVGLSNGVFTASGTIAADVVVDNAATLTGEATIQGTMTALSGGTVAPGVAGPGTLTVGGAFFNASSTYQVELNGLIPDTEHDQLVVNGTVSLGGATLDVTLGFTPLPGEDLVIIRNDLGDAVVGKFAEGDLATLDGVKFAIDYAFEADADLNLNDVALIRYGAALGPDPCDPSLMALYVSASTGDDLIEFIPVNGNSRIEVFINGMSEGVFEPSIHGLLIGYGQSGNDTINVLVPSRKVILYGNVGNDTLNSGNNNGILLGNLGDDLLIGGNQKDILIGGRGADTANGGSADDVLIAGYTSYDTNSIANRAALCSMSDELNTGQGGWSGRIDSLINGGGHNGTNVLDATTVFDDGDLDLLIGGHGHDWILANVSGGGVLDLVVPDKQDVLTDI